MEPAFTDAYYRTGTLIQDKNAGVTDAERQQLVADLEELVLRFGDGTKPENFDPHAVEAAANRLIKYYTRLNSSPPPVGMSPH